jgi:hypothetical protein
MVHLYTMRNSGGLNDAEDIFQDYEINAQLLVIVKVN